MNQDLLLPGDCLLYHGSGFFSRLIQIKTWSKISHVEVYVGGGQSVASRDNKGVNTYPFRTDGLTAVLRPVQSVDLAAALAWHAKQIGQRYDWLGLMRFFTIGKQSDTRSFCSEYACRFYRRGGFEPFVADIDADLVAPATFLYSPMFIHVAESAAAAAATA